MNRKQPIKGAAKKKPTKKSVAKKKAAKKGKKSEDCFITTACVEYFGLTDNCYQLQTLRRFRDEYMVVEKGRRHMVLNYYDIAPKVVEKLKVHPDRAKFFKDIFDVVNEACLAIEKNENEAAAIMYTNAVLELTLKLKLD